jgi:hypothetical protein
VGAVAATCNAAEAQSEKTKEQWLAEAKASATKLFSDYHALCSGRVLVKVTDRLYYEFSGDSAKVRVMGTYAIDAADKLNGKLWSGKMLVNMGDAARQILLDGEGKSTVSAWGYGREAEFDFLFADSQWKLADKIVSYTTFNFDLQPGVSCSAVGAI